MPLELSVILIIAGGIFVQALVGFGSALIAMPLLSQLIGIQTAAPLFAMSAFVGEIIMVLRYRLTFNWSAVWRLMLGSLTGIPIGILSASLVNERLMMLILGGFTLGYALYSLLGLRIMQLRNRGWAFGFGFASGWLSGAFNTGGPPYIIYGTSQNWTPIEFKTNLQSVFVLNSMTVIAAHALRHNITGEVLHYLPLTIPAVLAGLLLGFTLERFVSPARFRTGVLLLLVILGLSLIFRQ